MLVDEICRYQNVPCLAPHPYPKRVETDALRSLVARLFSDKAIAFQDAFGNPDVMASKMHNRRIRQDAALGGVVGGVAGAVCGLVVFPLIPLTVILGAGVGAGIFGATSHKQYDLCDELRALDISRAAMRASNSCRKMSGEVLAWESQGAWLGKMNEVQWQGIKEGLFYCRDLKLVRKEAKKLHTRDMESEIAKQRLRELRSLGKKKRLGCC